MRVIGLVLLAACHIGDQDPWLLDWHDCKLTSSQTQFIACRGYWQGEPGKNLIMELMTPSSTGSFATPGPGWKRIVVDGDFSNGQTGLGLLGTSLPMQPIGGIEMDFPCIGFVMGEIDMTDFSVGYESFHFAGTLHANCAQSTSLTATFDLDADGSSTGGGLDDIAGPATP